MPKNFYNHESGQIPEPSGRRPHPNLSDEINRNIAQSEIEGGVLLDNLPAGTVLEMETSNNTYLIKDIKRTTEGVTALMSSTNKQFFKPGQEVKVDIHGSTWGRAMLKLHYIGRGMFLEFNHPDYGVIRTSRIQDVRELKSQKKPKTHEEK